MGMLMVFMIIIMDFLHLKGLMLMVCLLLMVITLVIIFGHIQQGKEKLAKKWSCPCNNGSTETTSQYVGDDYYCESGSHVYEPYTFHYDDPLWDGKQCDYLESSCCTSPNMPWFVKSLNQSTTDDIELRMCTSEGYPDESTPVDIIELYVR